MVFYVKYSLNNGTFQVTIYHKYQKDNDDPLFETTYPNVMTPQNYKFLFTLLQIVLHIITVYF